MDCFRDGLPAPGIELLLEGFVLGPELRLGLFAAQELLDGIGLQGALDEGVPHIKQLIAAEAVLFIAHAHALECVLGHIAPVDGKIVGAGGELDVPRLAAVLGVKHPERRDLIDLFDENFFNDDEISVIKRARNYKTTSHPKNCDIVTYKYATGLESLIGYLDFFVYSI